MDQDAGTPLRSGPERRSLNRRFARNSSGIPHQPPPRDRLCEDPSPVIQRRRFAELAGHDPTFPRIGNERLCSPSTGSESARLRPHWRESLCAESPPHEPSELRRPPSRTKRKKELQIAARRAPASKGRSPI